MDRIKRHSKQVFIGVVGGIVLYAGVMMIPYPSPGWLVVFAGLAILSTEFAFAERILARVRQKYDEWRDWLKVQPRWVQWLVLAFTGLVVVVTLWLLNAYGLINSFLNLGLDWVTSPLAG